MASSEQEGGFYLARRLNPTISVVENKPASEALPQRVEVDGFRGEMAPRIAEWEKRGLGRAIGIPVYAPDGTLIPDEFRGIMFALPFSGRNIQEIDKSVLLLFPSDEACRFIVVGPKRSFKSNEKEKDDDNKAALGQFNSLFLTSRTRFIHETWRPDPDGNTGSQFIDALNHDIFPARFVTEIYRSKQEKDLLQALHYAMDRESVAVDDGSLNSRLGDAVVNDLVLLGDRFGGEYRAQKARDREVLDRVKALSGDEIKRRLSAYDFEPSDGTNSSDSA